MSEIDANIVVDGQKTVAIISQEGEIVKDGGEIDATCIVEDSNGKRHKAVKIVNIDDEPSNKSEIDAQILNNNNELITVTEEQDGEIIPQDNSEIDFHCLVQKDNRKQLSIKTVELNGEIIKSGGAIDATCVVNAEGKNQLAVKVFKRGGGTIETVYGTNSITFNAKANGLEALTLFGGTEQSGTPTPTTPVDIVSNNGAIKYSANIANVNAQTALIGYYTSAQGVVTKDMYNWMYQNFIPVKPNTTYTLSMSASVYYVSISEYSTAQDSGFVVRKTGGTGSNTQLTITTGATTNFVRFGTNIDRTEVTLEEVLAINWMLNEGGTALPYTPYVEGGIYTDGTVETIWAHGKNLFDKNSYTEINAYINSNTGVLTQGSPGTSTQYCAVIPCLPNTTYTISGRASSAWGAFTSSTIGTTATSFDRTKNGSITTGANDKYLIGLVRANQGAIDYRENLQVEQGSTATTYEPYVGGTATAEMLLKVGDYQDTQEVLSGVVTRKVGIKVLDGTELWAKGTSGSNFAFYINETGDAVTDSGLSCMSNIAVGVTNSWSSAGVTVRSNKNFGFVKPSNMTINSTVTDWTTYVSTQYANGTPVIIVYPLATPTTETVTEQTLTTKAGTNRITITQASLSSLDLEAKYKKANGDIDWQVGDRLDNKASFIGYFDSVNPDTQTSQRYAVFALDAVYRSLTVKFCGLGSSGNFTTSYSSVANARGSKESATYNTDYMLTNNSNLEYLKGYTSARQATTVSYNGVTYNAQTPNFVEIEMIKNNYTTLDTKDPTITDNPTKTLDAMLTAGIWSSTLNYGSYLSSFYTKKTSNNYARASNNYYGIVPVIEIPVAGV